MGFSSENKNDILLQSTKYMSYISFHDTEHALWKTVAESFLVSDNISMKCRSASRGRTPERFKGE